MFAVGVRGFGLVSAPGMVPYRATIRRRVSARALFHELGFTTSGKVKVSVLCPGWVKTNIADAHRNRPAGLEGNAGAQRSPQQQMMEGMIARRSPAALPPSNVADQVLAAIHERRFWILTHPEMKKAIEVRSRGILEGIDPKFDPTAL